MSCPQYNVYGNIFTMELNTCDMVHVRGRQGINSLMKNVKYMYNTIQCTIMTTKNDKCKMQFHYSFIAP